MKPSDLTPEQHEAFEQFVHDRGWEWEWLNKHTAGALFREFINQLKVKGEICEK